MHRGEEHQRLPLAKQEKWPGLPGTCATWSVLHYLYAPGWIGQVEHKKREVALNMMAECYKYTKFLPVSAIQNQIKTAITLDSRHKIYLKLTVLIPGQQPASFVHLR